MKFKVGDKVRIVKFNEDEVKPKGYNIGHEGFITEVDEFDCTGYNYEIDKDFFWHGDELKLVKQQIKIPCKFIGDTLPHYGKLGDSAMDIYAHTYQTVSNGELSDKNEFSTEGYVLNPLERILVNSGLQVEFPEGVDADCRPRSGMSLKYGIVTQLGMLDNNYRGDIGLIVINLSNEPYTIKKGDRLGQIKFTKQIEVELVEVDELSDSNRGNDGFGSTGK